MEWSREAKQVFQVQSYAPRPTIDGVQIVELRRFADDGGAMTELGRLTDSALAGLSGFTVRQVNYSEIEPGAIKAFHLHARQTDVWFVPPTDRLLLVLLDVRKGSRTEGVSMRFMLGAGASRLVRIPPGVAHGARNMAAAPGRIIYFTDVHFSPDPADCDEGRLPWDHLGADVWDMTRG
jgi:dTDP-4-dehydrorhamnose 3,5-epimerase